MSKANHNSPAPAPYPLGGRIYTVRGHAVMLDSDLAEAYEVETGALNRAVRRNAARFPEAFAFQLLQNEWDALRCQIGILNVGRGRHRKYLPYVFTEHGAVMLATVLNSDRAIKASIAVVQAFVRLRHLVDANRELSRRIDELNAKFEQKTGEDAVRFHIIFQELKRLALGDDGEPDPPRERIGFKPNKGRGTAKARKR
jgi:hypothetical protein